MKLIGVIVLFSLIAVSCQKEDIRPNATPASVPVYRSSFSSGATSTGNVSTIEEGTKAGITDPNDANRNSKTPRTKEPI